MARKRAPDIIVTRRPAAAEEEEHNGTWKLAYADFVTAMMTFFLIMWLLNVTTASQRQGIADYFNPISVSDGASGADAMLSGRSVDKSGHLTSPNAAGEHTLPVAAPPVIASVGDSDRAPAGQKEPSPHPAGSPNPAAAATAAQTQAQTQAPAQDLLASRPAPKPPAAAGKEEAAGRPADVSAVSRAAFEALLDKQAAAQDERYAFEKLEQEIRTALERSAELKALTGSLLIDATPEGLRVQLTDQARFAMFTVGSATLNEQGRQLMRLVARALAGVPNGLSIAGHTDALAYARDTKYGNWELSSDRANAARRELVAAGIPPARITRVEGRADLDHLLSDAPNDPKNRRISITVLKAAAQAAR